MTETIWIVLIVSIAAVISIALITNCIVDVNKDLTTRRYYSCKDKYELTGSDLDN